MIYQKGEQLSPFIRDMHPGHTSSPKKTDDRQGKGAPPSKTLECGAFSFHLFFKTTVQNSNK